MTCKHCGAAMTHVDLFSGIGGFALAWRRCGGTTVQFVEIDPFCQKVLNKNFPGVPIHDDIKTFKWTGTTPFILTGGFPCQDVSNAGKRMGITGKRSGLWQEMVRIISQTKPHWCVIENVSFLVANGLRRVLSDLNEIGYNTRWDCISAAHVGAPHIRDRIWIVAYPQSLSIDKPMEVRRILIDRWNKEIGSKSWIELVVGNNEVAPSEWRLSGQLNSRPLLIRNDDGVPNRVDRLKSLGNAIVPQIAYEIMNAIKEVSNP